MKRVLYVSLMILFASLQGHAATRGDVKIIEASENIRYLSQKIVTDYLYFYKYPTKIEVKNGITQALSELSSNFREIASTTKDSDTKDILDFLAYSKDQIAEMLAQQANEESVALMLDYSETLLEGANSIATTHRYDFSEEEEMLMAIKEMEYLLERMIKYYIALHIGFDSQTNRDQLQKAMMSFESKLTKINGYSYPDNLKKDQAQLNAFWSTSKQYAKRSEALFIPTLLRDWVLYLEGSMSTIALYHSKNQ